MCKTAQDAQKQKKELSQLDFRFHFFPWWKEPSYRLGSQVVITQEALDYFDSLKNRGITLDAEQMYWYAARKHTQGADMMREYPTTPEEAWESAIDGAYYAQQMSRCRLEKRIGFIPYDDSLPVYTAWDLGYNDSTAIWFAQIFGKEIRLIDYVEGSGESLAHWLGVVKSRPYIYEKHLAPHDIMVHEYTTGMTRQASARKMGVNLIPTAKVEIIPGIDQVRGILNRCFFDERLCSKGIKALENYKKQWNDRMGCWAKEPLHNEYSHGCFIGETLIECFDGEKRIDEICIGDLVKTPNGFKRVTFIHQYSSKNLLNICTDSKSIVCTPNHKIFTNSGLIYADALRYNDIILNRKEDGELCRKYGCHRKDFALGFRETFLLAKMKERLYSMDTAFDGTVFTIEEILQRLTMRFQVFIEQCGVFIREKFQKIITFITSTETQNTIIYQIYPACINANTWNMKLQGTNGLVANQIDSSSETTTKRLSDGIPVKKDLNGILSMGRTLGMEESRLKRSANNARKNMKHIMPDDLDFVVESAKQKIDTLCLSLGKREPVLSVQTNTKSENIPSQERVASLAPLLFREEQKVYDFEVEDDHCYYANGLLVSNSDAFRTLATGMQMITSQMTPQVKTLGNINPHNFSSAFR